MKRIAMLSALALPLALLGCEPESPLVPENELLVVRGYLYSGEPVTDIQLTTTFSLTSGDSAGLPINDASVTLERGAESFALNSSPGDSGYYHYPGPDLDVSVGDRFRISVVHGADVVSGETVIPAAPRNVRLSSTVLSIPTDVFFDTSSVTVSWDEEEDTFFFVTVDNQEAAPEPISDRGGFPPRGGRRGFRSRPIRDNEYVIRRFDLTYWGRHRVRVYKVNKEYAGLYAFGLQDSRNLNEPLTNIENGLGVFAGFSSETVYLEVTPQ